MTPLHNACMYGCLEVCQLLLDKGAMIESIDYENHTPLYYASNQCEYETDWRLKENRFDCIQLLIQKKAHYENLMIDDNCKVAIEQILIRNEKIL